MVLSGYVPRSGIGGSYGNSGLPWWLHGKESVCSVGDPGSIPGSGRSPGGEPGKPFPILAWRIPWKEEPRRLQAVGSEGVGHD